MIDDCFPAAARYAALLLIIVAGTVVGGCTGTVTVPVVERGQVPVIDSETQSVLVASTSFNGRLEGEEEGYRCTFYGLLYRGTEPATEGSVGDMAAIPNGGSTWDAADVHDYTVHDGLGFVSATVLPAGRYEIYFYNMQCGNRIFYSDEFSIPFELRPGEAAYSGEVRFNHRFGQNVFGMTMNFGADLELIDSSSRDTAIAKRAYPFLKALPVRKLDYDFDIGGMVTP